MSEKEITKPSLTQRRKITGSSNISSEPSIKPPLGSDMESSDDISIVKVGGVILAVIVVAIIAAFLIINLQGSDDGDKTEENQQETTPTTAPTVAPTQEPDENETETTPTPTPSQAPDEEEDDDNAVSEPGSFGQGTQTLASTATGGEFKIRTYQWTNAPSYYEFNLPMERMSGSANNPKVTASYNSEGDLILEVDNVGQFASCNYLNENNSNMAYGNVNKVSCERQGNKFIFTIDTISKTDFKLSYEEREIAAAGGEKVNAVVVQVMNK